MNKPSVQNFRYPAPRSLGSFIPYTPSSHPSYCTVRDSLIKKRVEKEGSTFSLKRSDNHYLSTVQPTAPHTTYTPSEVAMTKHFVSVLVFPNTCMIQV